ncbi:MAG: hypothetical protein JWL82_287 [Parcubacteria group bacterium]|nr:hypothetical protein [Parcubacteria group bacterium]
MKFVPTLVLVVLFSTGAFFYGQQQQKLDDQNLARKVAFDHLVDVNNAYINGACGSYLFAPCKGEVQIIGKLGGVQETYHLDGRHLSADRDGEHFDVDNLPEECTGVYASGDRSADRMGYECTFTRRTQKVTL